MPSVKKTRVCKPSKTPTKSRGSRAKVCHGSALKTSGGREVKSFAYKATGTGHDIISVAKHKSFVSRGIHKHPVGVAQSEYVKKAFAEARKRLKSGQKLNPRKIISMATKQRLADEYKAQKLRKH